MNINSLVNPINEIQKKASIAIILRAIRDNIKTKDDLDNIQKKICQKYKIKFLSNPQMMKIYQNLLEKKKIKPNKYLFEVLRKRKIRTSSGIASLAILTKPYACPGKCIFCPTEKKVPKSYLSNEPAVMRAILSNYDPIRQINIRLNGFNISGNPAGKLELIVMGGTWSYLPKLYQLKFIISCYFACNNYGTKKQVSRMSNLKFENNIVKLKKRLLKEQKNNETSEYRIIGLTLETRPDYITQKEILWFRLLGCTRVEIGVQSVFDEVLKFNKRGHGVLEIVKATKILKDAGFKINYHMMPNLPKSNLKKDLEMFKILFEDEKFQPDMLKIYPCVVTRNSKLFNLYKNKKYNSYSDKELTELLIKIKSKIPPYVRIQRIIRDIPAQSIEAGSKISNLRQLIKKNNTSFCKCIRCREIRGLYKENVSLRRIDYKASGGKEIFLEYIDKNDRIYAMLRLRILSNYFNKTKHKILDLDKTSIIREVHTFGPMLVVGNDDKQKPQHSGLGKKLIKEAEKITKKEFNLNKIAVISGVGVRNYYKDLGYKLSINGLYMNKKLAN